MEIIAGKEAQSLSNYKTYPVLLEQYKTIDDRLHLVHFVAMLW